MSVDAKVIGKFGRKGFVLQDCELSKSKSSDGNGKVRMKQLLFLVS